MFARCYEDRADRIYQRVDMGCEKRVRNASQIFDLCNHGTVVALNNLVHVMTIQIIASLGDLKIIFNFGVQTCLDPEHSSDSAWAILIKKQSIRLEPIWG